jgi:hypothetical protein
LGEGCRYMDLISIEYTNAPFPSRGPDRVCFVIAVEKAAQHTLGFVRSPRARVTGAGRSREGGRPRAAASVGSAAPCSRPAAVRRWCWGARGEQATGDTRRCRAM